MELKDKICVAPHQIFDYDLDIQDVGHNGAEEYIRKDKILEVLESFSNPTTRLFVQSIIESLNEIK